MAFVNKTSLFHNLLTASRSRTSSISSRRTKCSLLQSLIPPDHSTRSSSSIIPNPGESSSKTSHYHQHRHSSSATTTAASSIRLPCTETLLEKLRGMDITRDRIRLDGLFPPATLPPTEVAAEEGLTESTYTDEKKVMFLRAAQIEAMRLRLREIPNDWVTYSEFVEICGGSKDRGMVMARLLEDSGTVIVLGNSVCLHPEQGIKTLVVRAIQGLVPLPLHPHDPRRTQLAEMEKEKHKIDQRAKLLVQRELWGGLAYLVIQTAAFMRLTFWELSWDVMEPICFYVTSFYFMAGYGFFLRTSKEPSFEGFFQSRYGAKQRKLMKATGFDLDRYNELRRACGLPTVVGSMSRNTSSFSVVGNGNGGCSCH